MNTKERPIIFSGPMVRAILGGTKTQTRRVVKNLVMERDGRITVYSGRGHISGYTGLVPHEFPAAAVGEYCPFGVVGDRLWVKETLRRYGTGPGTTQYAADFTPVDGRSAGKWCAPDGRAAWLWKSGTLSSIHMPRWASRITLEVTGVRVERVQDISEEDAIAEGIRPITRERWGLQYEIPFLTMGPRATRGFRQFAPTPQIALAVAWNVIDAKRGHGWDANPWVWVIEFKRVEP